MASLSPSLYHPILCCVLTLYVAIRLVGACFKNFALCRSAAEVKLVQDHHHISTILACKRRKRSGIQYLVRATFISKLYLTDIVSNMAAYLLPLRSVRPVIINGDACCPA